MVQTFAVFAGDPTTAKRVLHYGALCRKIRTAIIKFSSAASGGIFVKVSTRRIFPAIRELCGRGNLNF